MARKKSVKKNKARRRLTSRSLLMVTVAIVALAAVAYFSRPKDNPEVINAEPQTKTEAPDNTPPKQEPAFDKTLHSPDEPASLWVVVNKGRKLPSTYQPNDLVVPNTSLRYSSGSEMQLRTDAAAALERMFKAAGDDDIKLMVASGFRSYGLQSSVFNRYVGQLGQSEAEKISARPGHSEHQTGWAVDVAPTSGQCLLEECFGNLAEGKWVAKNSYRYGFIVRYPDDKQKQTGYSYEPWHLRYIGKELGSEINSSAQTLEQFFGLPTYSTYSDGITQL